MEKVTGLLPVIDHQAPLHVQVTEETWLEGYTRKKLAYEAEPDSRVTAWLLIPHGVERAPAMLALHQTTKIGKDEPAGLGGNPNLHYGHELALRGYVVLIPDYPSFGDDLTDFAKDVYGRGYQSGTMKGIVNHMRGVDLLVSLPEVDAERIGVIGHSLGGHNALFAAAFDQRLKVAVTSCGFTAMTRYRGGNIQGWSSDRYMPLIASVFHSSAAELPWDFDDILKAIAPRAVFVNAPLHDDNFDWKGVDETVALTAAHFPPGRLTVVHPDGEHDFSTESRRQAYAFIAQTLK